MARLLGAVGAVIFSGASISLLLLLVDFILSSIIFLFTGSMNSAIDFGISCLFDTETDFFQREYWLVDTPLDGLDLLVNTTLDWQFNFYGRLWLLVTCGTVGGLLLAYYASMTRYKAKKGEDLPVEFVVGGLISMIVWAPMAWCSWMGLAVAGLQKLL